MPAGEGVTRGAGVERRGEKGSEEVAGPRKNARR